VSLPTRYQTNFIAVSRVFVQNIWATEAATANEAWVDFPLLPDHPGQHKIIANKTLKIKY